MTNTFKQILLGVLLLALFAASAGASNEVVVIGHPSVGKLDVAILQKVYTGKVIEVGNVAVIAVNAKQGSAVRTRFLRTFLNQDEDKYTGYWTVRRYIGKGAPPRELPSSTEMINFVMTTPGAIGYIDEADLKPGTNVLLKARTAARSLPGEFSNEAHTLLDQLVHLRMLVDAALDFPEQGIDFLQKVNAPGQLDRLQQTMASVLQRARQGSVFREDIKFVIADQSDAAKSSLLNARAGADLAIVTTVAGTTRDKVTALPD